jgi:predicted nucleic acid-binding protein
LKAFVDTNVLLYAVSPLATELTKRTIARDVLRQRDLAISIQVLNEFVWQSTRLGRGPGLPINIALQFTDSLSGIATQDLTKAVFDSARDLIRHLNYSWWDCLIVAAAQAQGCDILYSEDMQHGRIIDRLKIVDPFR